MVVPWAFATTLPVSVAAGRRALAKGFLQTRLSPLHTLDLPWRLRPKLLSVLKPNLGSWGLFSPYLVFFLDGLPKSLQHMS